MSCSPTHSRKESIHPMAIIYHKINQYMYLNYQIHRKPQKQKCMLQNFFWVGKLQIVLYILLSLFRFLFDRVQLNLLLYNHQKLPISTEPPAHRVNHYLRTAALYWLTSEINPVYINPEDKHFLLSQLTQK